MHRIVVLALAFLAIVRTTLAASYTSQRVSFPSGTENIVGYLATPDSPCRHPAVIVLHEDSGLSDWVKEQTRRLAISP